MRYTKTVPFFGPPCISFAGGLDNWRNIKLNRSSLFKGLSFALTVTALYV